MSLPETRELPRRIDEDTQRDLPRYLSDLTGELQDMYKDIAENVNGFIRTSEETDQTKWKPTIAGTTSAPAATTTYTTQIGWSIRKGIFTEIYFDITWTATTETGNLYVKLPYIVLQSPGKPFIGQIQPSNITFGAGIAGLCINAIPNTYRGEIWTFGSGIATANLAIPATAHLIGTISYVGKADE